MLQCHQFSHFTADFPEQTKLVMSHSFELQPSKVSTEPLFDSPTVYNSVTDDEEGQGLTEYLNT